MSLPSYSPREFIIEFILSFLGLNQVLQILNLVLAWIGLPIITVS